VPIFDRRTRPRNQPKSEKSYVDKKEWTDPNTDIATARYARLHTMWSTCSIQRKGRAFKHNATTTLNFPRLSLFGWSRPNTDLLFRWAGPSKPLSSSWAGKGGGAERRVGCASNEIITRGGGRGSECALN
jgi:hypothetical protein